MTHDFTKLKRNIRRTQLLCLAAIPWSIFFGYLGIIQGQWVLVAINGGLIGVQIAVFFWNRRTLRKIAATERMLEQLEMIQALQRGQCPDCRNFGMMPGPCGGASMNVACPSCGSRFNAHGANIADLHDLRLTMAAERL
jgi:DNA-directed RNA polymerase subunit RPC12/RpoP